MSKKQEFKPKKKAPSTKGKSPPAIIETPEDIAVQSKAGRPSIYTSEVMSRICERMAKGESLNAICKDEDLPAESTVRAWVLDNLDGISAKYTRAREMQADYWAEDILRIADESRIGTKVKSGPNGEEITTGDMVERTKQQIDARKWLLSKMFPKKYGDKIEVEGNMNTTVRFKWGG